MSDKNILDKEAKKIKKPSKTEENSTSESTKEVKAEVIKNANNQELEYASFGQRFLAWLVDGLIFIAIGIIFFVVGILLAVSGAIAETGTDFASGFVFDQSYEGSFSSSSVSILFILISLALSVASLVISWLYYALFHSSKFQATPGKMAANIKVTDMQGNPISFKQASVRYLVKNFPDLLSIVAVIPILGLIIRLFQYLLYFGYSFIAQLVVVNSTKKTQAIHDLAAKTVVIKS